jgi:hypothetical protein
MDERFARLAKLVGAALARRWLQIMADKKRPPSPGHVPRRKASRRRGPGPQEGS